MKKGFTLLEIVIVLAIFAIITTLVLAKYPEFKSSISLKKTAQEIALTVREAQVYSLGVKGFRSQFVIPYGVHFDITSPKSFILFADFDKDGRYVEDETAEKIKEYSIQTTDEIFELCGDKEQPSGEICGLTYLNIIFYRPTPIVTLKGYDGSFYHTFSDADIIIKSARGKQKTIVVWANGQILVKNE